jgi:hypothetical protein
MTSFGHSARSAIYYNTGSPLECDIKHTTASCHLLPFISDHFPVIFIAGVIPDTLSCGKVEVVDVAIGVLAKGRK